MSDREGEKLGNYQLTRFLGAGTFADVYLGEHVYLKRLAAIKVLRTRLAKDDMEGFLVEARTIGDLDHPNIVPVLEFGVENNVPFLVMSYAPNGTLRQRHPEGIPLAPTVVLPYVKQIASALQYAHDKKLIHRDIKPHNLLLNPHNQVWISDFGLVLIAQSTMSQVTQNPAGTPAYMAPEQFAGKPRPASDQYALGVVVYEWLCGERPFRGTYSELFSQHNFIPAPSLREKIPAISPAVDEVVLTALAKDPYKRFGSVKAFANALEQACKSEPYLLPSSDFDLPASSSQVERAAPAVVVPALDSLYSAAPTAPPLEAPPKDAAAPSLEVAAPPAVDTHTPTHLSAPEAGVPALELAAPAVESAYRPTHPGSSEAEAPALESAAPVGAAKDIYAPGLFNLQASAEPRTGLDTRDRPLSPDSPTVADAPVPSPAAPGLKRDLSRRTVVVGLVGTAVALGGGAATLIWRYASNANGPIPATPSTRHLVSHPAATPTPAHAGTTIFTYHKPGSGVRAVAWSPNGQLIASGGTDNLVRVWRASSKKDLGQELSYSPYKGHSRPLKTVAWSPSGLLIASGSEDATVHVWDATTGQDVLVYKQHTTTVRSVAWSPNLHNGRQFIASGSEDKTVRVWDAASGQDVLAPYTLHTAQVSNVAWSPDGKLIASASFDGTVRVWSASSGQDVPFSPLLHHPGARAVAWSRDGQYIASGGDDRSIKLWDAKTGQLLRTFSGHRDSVESVAWSPDGQYIISGSFDATVKVWSRATGGMVVDYRHHTNQVWSVSWSPDGHLIASGSIDNTVQLWTPIEEIPPLTS